LHFKYHVSIYHIASGGNKWHVVMRFTRLLYTNSSNKRHQLATVRRHCLQHRTVATMTTHNEALGGSV